jgi:hypothetical protein
MTRQQKKKEKHKNNTGMLDMGINTRRTQHYLTAHASQIGISTRATQLISGSPRDNSSRSKLTSHDKRSKTEAFSQHPSNIQVAEKPLGVTLRRYGIERCRRYCTGKITAMRDPPPPCHYNTTIHLME